MKRLCTVFGHNPESKSEKVSSYREMFRCPDCEELFDDRFEDCFWKSEEFEFLRMLLMVFLGMALILFIIFLITTLIGSLTSLAKCNSYLEMGVNTQFNFWTGCMANHPKFGWVPVEKYFEIINLYIP